MSEISEAFIEQQDHSDDDIFYDIDSSLAAIQAHAENSRLQYQGQRNQNSRTYNHCPPRLNTRLPSDKWQHLSPEDRMAWNGI